MTTRLHGVDLRLEMVLPSTGFILDSNTNGVLNQNVLGAPAGWRDIGCDVVAFSIQRGDAALDQRPNCALELGTMTVEVYDNSMSWIPDDLCRLLGLPLSGLVPGMAIRLSAANPENNVWYGLFYGQVTSFDGEWLSDKERIVTINCVDGVAVLAAINPTALTTAWADGYLAYQMWNYYMAVFLPAGWDQWFDPESSGFIQFRGETFGDPLMVQLQRWGDTALAHLAVRCGPVSTGSKPQLVAADVARTAAPYASFVLMDCALQQPLQAIPLHGGHLTVDAAGIVNDCLGAADRTQVLRYRTRFLPYGGSTSYANGELTLVTSDGGTTWGAAIGDKDKAGNDWGAKWGALPLGSELEVQLLGEDQQGGGRSFRFEVQGATSKQPNGWWLSGLIARTKIDYPSGMYRAVFGQTSEVFPDSAVAVRTIDSDSQALYGKQDYRRLDLRLYNDGMAKRWTDKVVALAKGTISYLDEMQVDVHLPNGPRATNVDLLDRVEATKQFAGRQVKFTGDVVAINDECDAGGWVRTFHISPISSVAILQGGNYGDGNYGDDYYGGKL